MNNIAFAMELNDQIPEHIRQEIIREESVESVGRERNESIEEFNTVVSRKLPQQQLPSEDVLFSEIQGYNDLKHLLTKMVMSDQSVHAVLVGPPGSGKTMFLMSIQQKMKDAFYIDGTNASGPGIVDKLFSLPDTEVIIVDEIEKMSIKDQNVLLNLLETGKLVSTKVRKTAEMEFKGIKLFATSNDIDLLSKPLRSRLIELHLPEYKFEEFQDIVIRLASDRHDLDEDVGKKIARVVWYDMKTRDVRDAMQLTKLVDNVNDVELLAGTITKYKRRNSEE